LPKGQGENSATEQADLQENRKAIGSDGEKAQRHITVWATLDRLCGRPHNRSVTLAPRRYRDRKTGEWKDATSYRPVDLAIIILALQATLDFIQATPLPGQPVEEDELEEFHEVEDGRVPENPPSL
jgi:hypothetical protein